MNLTISEKAAHWYKNELDIKNESYVRYFVRYGGIGGLIPGFSLGVNEDSPQHIHTFSNVDNITFYIEEADAWYFGNKDLTIGFDEKLSEPIFSYSN